MTSSGQRPNRAPAERYANNLRATVATNFARRRLNVSGGAVGQQTQCAQIQLVDLYLKQNAAKHNTDRYVIADESLILRRGTPFYIALRTDRELDPNVDTVKIIMSFGPSPNVTKGSKNILMCVFERSSLHSQPGKWDAVVSSLNGSDIILEIEPPSTCQIGIWRCSIFTGLIDNPNVEMERKIEEDIYMLLNPWNQADLVYMPDEVERNEYVLNDVGKVWMGSYHNPKGRRWLFGQFEDAALPCSVYLLELSDLPHEDRGNPVLLARAISAVVNADDDYGLIIGKWDGDYSEGTSPHAWTGSLPIMQEYLESGATPVGFGQCWVFSGLTVTVCRALGLPCRSVTNYVSAHDTNSSLTVDKYFDAQGEEIKGGPDGTCHDSCWNFHVWNDVWMSRPDLPPGYGGWQIIDSTPQEMSGNMMRCGPASIEAVRKGQVGFLYDTPFIFSEVNADMCHFKEDPKSVWGFTRTKINAYYVGKRMITKKVGVDDDQGDRDLWDITQLYKNPEGSKEERMTVFNAVRGVDKAQLHYNVPDEQQSDVRLDLLEIDQVHFGQPFNVVVQVENLSSQVRNVEAVLAANSVFYTGVKYHSLKKMNYQINLMPFAKETIILPVQPEEYETKMIDHSLIKIYSIASVAETNQIWSEEDDFPLLKPPLDIQVSGSFRVGEPCSATFSFTNPLRVALTGCKFSLEGPGLQYPKIINCPDVEPFGNFTYTESFHPRRTGERKIVGIFCSTQLTDVDGSVGVKVQS